MLFHDFFFKFMKHHIPINVVDRFFEIYKNHVGKFMSVNLLFNYHARSPVIDFQVPFCFPKQYVDRSLDNFLNFFPFAFRDSFR